MLSTAFGYTCKPFTRGGSKLKGHLYTFMLATHPSPPHTNITIRQHARLLPRDLALYLSLLLSISLLICLSLDFSLSLSLDTPLSLCADQKILKRLYEFICVVSNGPTDT